MKTIVILMTAVILSLSWGAQAQASASMMCSDNQKMGGVDVWPWSIAKPFPWDNIQGYWKLGDDESSYIRARVLSSTNNRKILSLSLYGEGICSKPYAKGTGYVDVSEKNVVRALLTDGVYKYQMKLGLFDARDLILSGDNLCNYNIMAVSMQVIGRAKRSGELDKIPLDPSITETHNMLLKKVSVDPSVDCN